MSNDRHADSRGEPRAQKSVLYLCDSERWPWAAIEEICRETDSITYRELREGAAIKKGGLGVVTKEDLNKMTEQGSTVIVDPFFPGGRKP